MDNEFVKEQQLDLEKAVREYLGTGSQESREKVIALGQSMAHNFASLYSPGAADSGMKRAASTGFHKAIKRFDPSKEVYFSTYATHCIISEIRDELKTRQLFKVPEWLKKLQDDVVRATEELTRANQLMPTLREISNKVNVEEKGIAEAMQAGTVSLDKLNTKSIKGLRYEAFKLPVEDVIKIRKSLDRLSDIQLKVLSLFSTNLKELRLAMEEEEKALSNEQEQYLSLIENDMDKHNLQLMKSFKLDFPLHFSESEAKRYFEVLSDEYGLRLTDIIFINNDRESLSASNLADDKCIEKSIELLLEGRYRGLLQLLDYLRNDEEAMQVEKVRTTRNETIPARISIYLNLSASFSNSARNGEDMVDF